MKIISWVWLIRHEQDPEISSGLMLVSCTECKYFLCSLRNDCCRLFPNPKPNAKENPTHPPNKSPDTPAHLTQPNKQNTKAQITREFTTTTTALANSLHLPTPRPHHRNTTSTPQPKRNKPGNRTYPSHKTLFN